jgi:hypothetical protein
MANTKEVSIAQVTEVRYEWTFGNYFARTWFGAQYGTFTEWFKNDSYVTNENSIPEEILMQHQTKLKEVEANW